MQINQLKTMVLSSIATRNRQHRIVPMLKEYGWTDINVITAGISDPYWLGCIRSMRIALDAPPPLLILEDDATLIKRTHPISLDLPPDAGMVYIGTTPHGVPITLPPPWRAHHTPTPWSPLYWQPATRHYLRVGNMLSTHAIIVATTAAARWMRSRLDAHEPTDVSFGRYMHEIKVYARRYPIFFQNDGHNAEPTLMPLANMEQAG